MSRDVPKILQYQRTKRKMNLIRCFAALSAVAMSASAGSADVAQCNGRSVVWINPSVCTDAAKCSESQILSAPKYEMCDIIAWEEDEEEKVESMLTNFMTWASLTRDVEMQKEGQELCGAQNENMPWDIQMCAGDLKLVHRTQPMLGHGDYNFDPKNNPAMSGKETTRTSIKSRFGLPREKVRNFMSLLKPRTMHWHKIPAELYV